MLRSRGGAERVILFETVCYLFVLSPESRDEPGVPGWHTGIPGEQNPPANLPLPPSGQQWEAGAVSLQTPVWSSPREGSFLASLRPIMGGRA